MERRSNLLVPGPRAWDGLHKNFRSEIDRTDTRLRRLGIAGWTAWKRHLRGKWCFFWGSMVIPGSQNGGTLVPYFWPYSGGTSPYIGLKIGLTYGRYLQFRFLRWPVNRVVILGGFLSHQGTKSFILDWDFRNKASIFGVPPFQETSSKYQEYQFFWWDIWFRLPARKWPTNYRPYFGGFSTTK